jgi:hypothetical protein
VVIVPEDRSEPITAGHARARRSGTHTLSRGARVRCGCDGRARVQLALVRPRLARRSRRVLAGEHSVRSRSHHAYVASEVTKALGLLSLAWTALR